MKKPTAILLAAVMTFVVTACGIEPTLATSRTKAFYESVDFTNFALVTEEIVAKEKMTLYVKGDSAYMKIEGSGSINDVAMLTVGKVTYLIDDKNKIYAFKDSDDELSGIIAGVKIDFNNAVLCGYGNSDFMGETRYYEEIMTIHGEIIRHYFDTDSDTVIGQAMNGLVFSWDLSSDIPKEAFEVPSGYIKVEIGEDFDY